jgi:hypothetical protein
MSPAAEFTGPQPQEQHARLEEDLQRLQIHSPGRMRALQGGSASSRVTKRFQSRDRTGGTASRDSQLLPGQPHDVYYPDWSLTVNGRPAGILRTNRAMRGAALPAGTHHLVFRYEPRSFRVGIACSTLGFGLLAALGAWAKQRSNPPAQ